MKDIFGFFLFIIGLGGIIEDSIKHPTDTGGWWPFIFVCVMCGLIAWGLDLIITAKIDTAKEEMREELEKKLEERGENVESVWD